MLRFARDDEKRRKGGRILCELLGCTLGEVVDLSAGGMRVRRRGVLIARANQTVHLTLTHDRHKLKLRGRIAWIKRTGFCRQDIGIEFGELSQAIQATLIDIARSCAASRLPELGMTGT